MEPSGFEVEFPQHTAVQDRDYWIVWLRDKGAIVEVLGTDRYSVTCIRPRQLEHAGWALYHTALSRLVLVTRAFGVAEARASAYIEPSKA